MMDWMAAPAPRRRWAMFTLLSFALVGVTLIGAHRYATDAAMQELRSQGRIDAGLKVALLRAVLERPRALPMILSRDREVEEALREPTKPHLDALNRKLQELVAGTNASVLYLIDRRGITIASSNSAEPTSFVGSDYSFRDYFSRAMAEGKAEHFALGSVSLRPGLYISERVGPKDAPLGVIVVKAEFDQLERDWRETLKPTFVADRDGVVLITSVESWRFMTTATLAPALSQQIRSSLQFGNAPLIPLPMVELEPFQSDARVIQAVLPGERQTHMVEVALAVPSTPWKLHYLLPTEPQLDNAVGQAQLAALAILLPLLALAALVLMRRQAVLARIEREQSARIELERRVEERTLDLRNARDRLETEISDHRTTEARLQGVQQELVQANRLAILGQVAAGVAHEINQPVATIRAYADNAATYLDRDRSDAARDNLREIAGLTERIGMITEDLKALARRGRSAAGPVNLQEAVSGATMLLRSRFAGRLDALRVDLPAGAPIIVQASQLRLEQVLINLFQNALEAIEGREDGRVSVNAHMKNEHVFLTVEDNGPGIPQTVREHLFSPFNSSKEKGLGLGLVIAKDIISDYGGRISVDTSDTGTCFTIELKQVQP